MDKEEFRRRDRRTALWVGLAACVVVLIVAYFVPYDSMVTRIISNVMRGF